MNIIRIELRIVSLVD